MSEFSDYSERLNMREQLARIDQLLTETQKFQREANKLRAEEKKLDRDHSWQPVLAITGIVGGLAGLVGGLVTILAPFFRATIGH